MSKRDDAIEILVALGMPKRQQNDNAIYTLLAFAEDPRHEDEGQQRAQGPATFSLPKCAQSTWPAHRATATAAGRVRPLAVVAPCARSRALATRESLPS